VESWEKKEKKEGKDHGEFKRIGTHQKKERYENLCQKGKSEESCLAELRLVKKTPRSRIPSSKNHARREKKGERKEDRKKREKKKLGH